MSTVRAITSIVSASVLALLASAQDDAQIRRYDAQARSIVEFDITKTKDPLFPNRLRAEGIMEGTVTFAVYIDQLGNLKDFLLLEASKLEFAAEVEKVLPLWKFSVPFVDGESAAIISTVKVNFERSGLVVYESPGLGYLNQWDRSSHSTDYRIYALWELDAIPEPIDLVKPDFHTELLEDRDLVNAVFDFYIDAEGRVRMPTLRQADDKIDERLLVIAQESLLRWRFAAPKVKGRNVVAKAAQPFRFQKAGLPE